MTRRRGLVWLWPLSAVLAIVAVAIAVSAGGTSSSSPRQSALVPTVDTGTPLSRPAPDFTLTDQFGKHVSLSAFRGRVVILAFNDSQCTTVCPLTTSAMVDAKRLLGPAGAKVALLGIDANPQATQVKDVRSYSQLHGMTHSWQFLTGSLAQLRSVWHKYGIEVAITRGQIDHTPALFVIDRAGRLVRLYLTTMAYASIGQQAQLLAQKAASLLPGHPRVASTVSYEPIPTIPPPTKASVPLAGGGTLALGPARGPRLYAFFATWDAQVTPLAKQLRELDRYATIRGLPPLTAVDEGSVEPSPATLPRFLSALGRPLAYPVAIDASGRVADGYGVQDEPWFVLVSPGGKVLWYYDIATSGWLSTGALIKQVRAALARPGTPSGAAAVQAALAGSPAPLAALHQQADQVLGGIPALLARLRTLRGYPVVVNAWASWCGPCQSEFGVFGAASARYGRQVAFVGVDTYDNPSDAAAFLRAHRVSYPSYQSPTPAALSPLGQVFGLPTTFFINGAGKLVYVKSGPYLTVGALNQDIATYAR
jgi:cytochrome oxidase Cu insertion factor (SCO1/SenC/PrrC family)/thiol-disulfide isomerase/thioredoxin